jgi:hypothetical protein
MIKHYSKKSEKKYNKLVELNPNMEVSGTRFFEWAHDTVIEFTCKYGHISEFELRYVSNTKVKCPCDGCAKDRAAVRELHYLDNNKSEKETPGQRNHRRKKTVMTEARRLARKYIKKHNLDIPACEKELAKDINRDKRLQFHIIVAKHTHDFFYQYDLEKIREVTKHRMSEKVPVTCPKHGEFNVRLSGHYSGTGCPECYKEGRRVTNVMSVARTRYIQESRKLAQAKARVSVKSYRNAIIKASRRLAKEYIEQNNIGIPSRLDELRGKDQNKERRHFHLIACQMINNFYYEYDLEAWQAVENVSTDKVPIGCPNCGTHYVRLVDHYAGAQCPCLSSKGKLKGRKITLPLELDK